jgi:cell division septation protein DedD
MAGDKDALRWSVSWHPEGRCDTFTESAILACAPPVSGVYGLFNFDYQLFIGEAANIQEALLRHQSETDAQPAHLRPTGFTFEPCSAEIRKRKADELIALFRPVPQSHPKLRDGVRKNNVTTLRTTGVQHVTEDVGAQQEFPLVEQRQIETQRRSRLSLLHAAVASLLTVAAIAILYFGAASSNSVQDVVDPASTKAVASFATSDRSEPSFEPPTPRRAEDARTGARNRTWSVQVAAVPDKDVADRMVQQLIAGGHDGYMVRAEVKGQTFYRVRVGRHDVQQQAESLRQELAREGGHADAFLAVD